MRLPRLCFAALLAVAVVVTSDGVRGQEVKDPAVPADRAHIQVKFPPAGADAVLLFGKSATEAKGPDRLFESTKLEKGKEYQYELTASWTADGKETKETRIAKVSAGKKVVVDFGKPDAPPKDKDATPKDKDAPPKDKDAPPKDKDGPSKDKDKDKDKGPGKDQGAAYLETRRAVVTRGGP